MEVATIFLPLIGCIVAGLFGRSIGARGAMAVTVTAVCVSAVLSVILFFKLTGEGSEAYTVSLFTFIDSGAFEVDVKAHIDLSAYFLLVHARPEKAGFYYKLPTDAPDTLVDAGSRLVLTLPASGSELSVSGSGAPAQSATSGDVTLDVPDGVDVKLDVEDVTAGPIGAEFRVLTVPDDERDTFVDPSLNVLALYAVAPFEATFLEKGSKTPAKASLTFTNTTGLAADTPVELLTMGSYYVDQNLAPGAFGPAATGHVSSDGASITLDPGEGVTYLTWFALREKK